MTNTEKMLMFENRLRKVSRHLGRQAVQAGVTCYRLYDRDLPEFPLIVERYAENLSVAEYRSNHGMDMAEYTAWLQGSLDIISKVTEIAPERLFLRERKRKQGRQDQYGRAGSTGRFHLIEEGGLKFLVNLESYLDTGLFLDHRVTRDMVRREAEGKRVLNLFCYTGSFSVYAAAGRAAELVSVDMSNTYLDWAQRNMALNFSPVPERFRFIRADVLQYLPELPADYFDLVILDPPTFSNSKKMKEIFDIQQDHPELIRSVMRTVRRGGRIYFSTNARTFRLETELLEGLVISDVTARTTPFDFKNKLQRHCYIISK